MPADFFTIFLLFFPVDQNFLPYVASLGVSL